MMIECVIIPMKSNVTAFSVHHGTTLCGLNQDLFASFVNDYDNVVIVNGKYVIRYITWRAEKRKTHAQVINMVFLSLGKHNSH